MTLQEFNMKIEKGEAKVLTLEAAKLLKGKSIIWTYFGYEHNQQDIYETIVGDIMTELDYYETQPMDGWTSRAAYWRSYMKKEQLDRFNKTLVLLNDKRELTHIKCHLTSGYFDEPTFTCSDEDRCVFFLEN